MAAEIRPSMRTEPRMAVNSSCFPPTMAFPCATDAPKDSAANGPPIAVLDEQHVSERIGNRAPAHGAEFGSRRRLGCP
jgi:hypothetical protein